MIIGQRLTDFRKDYENPSIADFLWENRKHFLTNNSINTSDQWGLVTKIEGPYSSPIYNKSAKYKFVKEALSQQGVIMEFNSHDGTLRFTISPTLN